MTTRPLKTGERCHLTIERLAVGGRGVARHEGLVIFVSDVAPGESVEVELTTVKKNFAEARLVEVLTPSVHRASAPCPVFGVCGGCVWQHVNYDEQLKQKRGFVHDALKKFSKFEIGENLVQNVVPSPDQYRYRNRIQLHYRRVEETILLGFHQRSSHRIIDIQDCLITEEALTRHLPQLRQRLQGSGRVGGRESTAGRFEMYLAEDGEVRNREAFSDTQMDDSFKERSNSASSAKTEKGSPAPPFAQVNTAQNANLVRHCLEVFKTFTEPDKIKDVYDLYAGNGNFTFPLAELFTSAQIQAVELNPESVQRGTQISRERGLFPRVRFTASDVADFLGQKRPPKNSIMLLDPPRAGCAPEVMQAIAHVKPSLIVYVSCHPVTLARDLERFREATQDGFELNQVLPFDMFPQTDHVEVVAVLRRKSEPEKP